MTAAGQPQLSALDEERFGVRTAKAFVSTIDEIPALINSCHGQRVRFLIVRCPAEDLAIVQALEAAGCRLMDVLVYYLRDLQKTPIPSDASPVLVRPARTEDVEAVVGVARSSFRGYLGHYHADPRLDREACDEVYVSWARRSCLSCEVADEVIVAEDAGVVVGFLTLGRAGAEEGQAVLSGVAPTAQGKGIFRSFMVWGMDWTRRWGGKRMVYSTQVTNIAGQKVVARLGFEMHHTHLTFHKWFDI